MNTELTLERVRQFGTALLLGVLMGIDREKRKEAGEANFGGIRTFMLIALSGATAAHVGRLAVFVKAARLRKRHRRPRGPAPGHARRVVGGAGDDRPGPGGGARQRTLAGGDRPAGLDQ